MGFETAVEAMARRFCVAAGEDPDRRRSRRPAWRAYEAWSRQLLLALKHGAA
jgi:hypothetical protein